jgi:predicted dehydrogenase
MDNPERKNNYMSRKIKIGVFGVGSLGQHHARIYSQLENAELVGIYDINKERATAMAAQHGAQAFDSVEELASKIEASSVVVPTDKHFEMFQKLVPRGIHMLVEKPIAATSTEAEKMVEIAQAKNLILQVGHVERFNPVMKFLEDKLSQPKFIEVIRIAPYPPPRPDGLPRGTEVSVVLDLMIHDLEIILHLVKSPVKDVHAVGVPVLSTTEDIANVRLLFESGCVANVTASRISQEKIRKIRVFQSDTYVSLDYMNQAGQLCRKVDNSITVEQVPIEKGEPLRDELASFVDCVMTRSEPVVTGRQASEALKLAARICNLIRQKPS